MSSSIELRCGDWREALADVGEVDALITDPPYSESTHAGQADCRDELAYKPWTPDDVHAFVEHWAPRTRGWFVALTDEDLVPHWKAAYLRAKPKRTPFASIPIIQHAPRLQGDGPGTCAIYAVVSRPSTREWMRWRSLPGWYKSHRERDGIVLGAKPLELMRMLVRDYSRLGRDVVVCDPCAGGATTLLAAAIEGRRAIGAERDPVTHAKALARIARGYTPTLFDTTPRAAAEQADLFAANGGGEDI